MRAVRVGIAKEVGECNGGERVVVRVGGFVEFNHCG
jgi:hypothetical protein